MSLDPALQPIDWATIEQALWNWASTVTGVPTSRIIWENQKIAQPAYPYVSLHKSPVLISGGKPELRYETDLGQPQGEEIEFTATSQCEFTLSASVYMDAAAGGGNPTTGAFKLASKLQASLGLKTIQESLSTAGLAIIQSLPVLDLSEVVNAEFLDRAVFEVRLRVASEMTEKTGYIADVELEYDPYL